MKYEIIHIHSIDFYYGYRCLCDCGYMRFIWIMNKLKHRERKILASLAVEY